MSPGRIETVPCAVVASHPHPRRPGAGSDAPTAGPSRRSVLRGGLGLGAATVGGILLGSCSSEADTRSADNLSSHALLAAFPQTLPHIPAGVPFRLPYLISDDDGVPLTTIDGAVTFTVSRDGHELGTVRVEPHSDGVPRAYLPVGFTFPEPGRYDLTATYDGAPMSSTVEVVEPERVGPPVVGQKLPPVDSPTTERTLEVDPLCSRLKGPCPLHSVNLRDAVGLGKPIVVVIATPAYCSSDVCAPLLELVLEQTAGRDDLVVTHQEVYKNPKGQRDLSDAQLAPVPDAYRLRFEPVLYVTDRTGTIVARADITVDRGELSELLALAV